MSDPAAQPATVTAVRGDARIRCVVITWEDGVTTCRPMALASEWLPVLSPGAAVGLSWSIDTALLAVDAVIDGRPENGVLTMQFTGPVETLQRRDRVRVRCVLPCDVVTAGIDGEWAPLRVESIDLSATGMAVRMSRPPAVGERCAVVLHPADEAPMVLAAMVASVALDSGRVGLGFTSLLPGDADRIGGMVARLLSNRAVR